MIVVEGNCWGNNHNGLWPLSVSDNNIALFFHLYWIDNHVGTIQQYLYLRQQHNVPLLMTELGENNNGWYQDALALLESHNIGWAWWPWKKLHYGPNDNQGAYQIQAPSLLPIARLLGWSGRQPDPTYPFQVMMQVVENSKLVNSIRQNQAITALTQTLQAAARCDGNNNVLQAQVAFPSD